MTPARPHKIVTAAPPCLSPGGSAEQVQLALRVVDGRWKLDILFRLFATPVLRFSELQRSLGAVSHRMLTLRLRELERDGVIARTVHPTVPPSVDYRLTTRGHALRPILRALRDWRLGRDTPP